MLVLQKLISERKAQNLVFDMTRYNDRSDRLRSMTLNNKQIKNRFKRLGTDFKSLVSKARSVENNISPIENLSGPTGQTENLKVETSDQSGDVIASVDATATVTESDYLSKFKTALDFRDRAIEEADVELFYACLSKSFAALEAYFNIKADYYNRIHISKLVDSKDNPLSLVDKITSWVPMISGGASLDLSQESWLLFNQQLDMRTQYEVSSKQIAGAVTQVELASHLNNFRDGFSRIFLDIHILLSEPTKNFIIRAPYHPDVIVKSE